MKKPRNTIFLGYCLFFLAYIGVTVWGCESGTFSKDLRLLSLMIMILLVPSLFFVYLFSHNHTIVKAAKTARAALPEIQTLATVIHKAQKPVSDHYCYIAFEFPDGKRKTFKVDSDTYAVFEKGDTGTLTYKEGSEYRFFVSFKRQINGE